MEKVMVLKTGYFCLFIQYPVFSAGGQMNRGYLMN